MLVIAAPVIADRQPSGLTTVKRSPATGNIEIIHRLHNHDAELGMLARYDIGGFSLDALEGQARFALYVEEQFLLASGTDDGVGAPLSLELIGAELDGQYILVYQEYVGELPDRLAVRNDILRDVFPEQVNHVNIAVGGPVRSLTFGDDDTWRTTQLN